MATSKHNGTPVDGAGSMLSTVSGPSTGEPPASVGSAEPVPEQLLEKVVGSAILAAKMPFNSTKALEYGAAAREPHAGVTHAPDTAFATASAASAPAVWPC